VDFQVSRCGTALDGWVEQYISFIQSRAPSICRHDTSKMPHFKFSVIICTSSDTFIYSANAALLPCQISSLRSRIVDY
jgi:hypothetical protein